MDDRVDAAFSLYTWVNQPITTVLSHCEAETNNNAISEFHIFYIQIELIKNASASEESV